MANGWIEGKLEVRECPQVDSLRDRFAMAALTGLISNPHNAYAQSEHLVMAAFMVADEMMVEREKRKGGA
jgi:hypothetical protein